MKDRKDVSDMTVTELRQALQKKRDADTRRGVAYRARQRAAQRVRFSTFVPADCVSELQEVVKRFLRERENAVHQTTQETQP
jgi:hypothetical protein